MTVSSFIKRTLTKSCVYFTLITAIYAIIVMIINVDDDLVLLDAGRVLLFFVASLLFAIGNMLSSLSKMNGALKVVLHYLVYLFTFCSCFMLPILPDASAMIIGITLFTFIYAIALVIFLVVRSRYKTRSEIQEDYRPRFKK